MRKLAFLSVFMIVGFTMGNALAAKNCYPHACAGNMDNKDKIPQFVGGDGNGACFFCADGFAEDDECAGNVLVAQADQNYMVKKVYQCNDGFMDNDYWSEYGTGNCSGSTVRPEEINADYCISNSHNSKNCFLESNAASPTRFASSGVLCKWYFCKEGFQEVDGKCVDSIWNLKCTDHAGGMYENGQSLNILCTESSLTIGSPLSSTAHLKPGAVCTGKCEAAGWNITLKDDSCDTDFGPDSSRKKCQKTAAANRRDQQRRENASKKEKCEESGGTWASNKCTCASSKNLKKEGDECVCLDANNYTYDAASKSCKLTNEAALRQACEAAADTGAYFEDGKCKCQDRDSIWRGNKCVENPDIKRCKSATGTRWDYNEGACVCKDSNYEYDEGNNECVETDVARNSREEARKKAELDAAKVRITSIKGKLDNLRSGLSKSVWKNKEGNFNTSRLVSDSVAGVVLGTAGGLITSNVIKKNQVKGGFEDINCTVRGQVVAGYGDEFQVGIQ